MFHLPDDYRDQPVLRWSGRGRSGRTWQFHVYERAIALCATHHLHTVLDVGCGDGDKSFLFREVGLRLIGLIEPGGQIPDRRKGRFTAIHENELAQPGWADSVVVPEDTLIICADVIEHLQNPDILLAGIASLNRRAVLSTPDRAHLYPVGHNGPPLNTQHVREWTAAEFHAYVSEHLTIVSHGILPQYRDVRWGKNGSRGTTFIEAVPRILAQLSPS